MTSFEKEKKMRISRERNQITGGVGNCHILSNRN